MPASQNHFAPELNEKEVIELLEDHIMIIYVDLHMYSAFAGVPGEKPQVTSDKLPDSPSKFPCIQL